MNKAIVAAALLAFSLPAMADKLEGCTTKASKTTPKASLASMAKITKAAAEKIALDSVTGTNKKVTETELETEDGCLVYSVDVTASGKKDELLVDAGNGKILKHKHEGRLKAAVSNLKDKITPSK